MRHVIFLHYCRHLSIIFILHYYFHFRLRHFSAWCLIDDADSHFAHLSLWWLAATIAEPLIHYAITLPLPLANNSYHHSSLLMTFDYAEYHITFSSFTPSLLSSSLPFSDFITSSFLSCRHYCFTLSIITDYAEYIITPLRRHYWLGAPYLSFDFADIGLRQILHCNIDVIFWLTYFLQYHLLSSSHFLHFFSRGRGHDAYSLILMSLLPRASDAHTLFAFIAMPFALLGWLLHTCHWYQ